MNKKRSNLKDYVLMGVMSALNAVLIMIGGIITNFFGPVIHVLLAMAISGLMSGTIILLITKKTNMKWIFTTVFLITMLIFQLIGMGYLPWVITTLLGAMLGDLISCKSKYQNKVLLSLSHGITVIGLSGGNLLPVLLFADKFRSDFTARGIDPEYMDTLINFLKGPMSLVVILLSFISGIVGIYIGNKIFKKHFENAGHIQSKHI